MSEDNNLAKSILSDFNNINKMGIKKAQVIELWRSTRGHITNMCSAAGINRTTFYNWIKKDKDFALAIIEAEQELNDDIREVLIHKAGDGDLGAIIFYLKKRHPDFLDRPNLTQVNIDMNLEIVPDEEKA